MHASVFSLPQLGYYFRILNHFSLVAIFVNVHLSVTEILLFFSKHHRRRYVKTLAEWLVCPVVHVLSKSIF